MKFVTACLGFLLCSSLCSAQNIGTSPTAQGQADFKGTWVLDDSNGKSNKTKRSSSREVTLVITHHEPEIRIARNFKEKGHERIDEVVYYSDGRGETNPTSLRTFPQKN